MTLGDAEAWAATATPEANLEPDAATLHAIAEAAAKGLLRARNKRLPAWLLYDARGSALFEEITELPEYYLTRTERAIFAAYAAEMIDAAGPPLAIAELGAGTASKTQLLLAALLARQGRGLYLPIDVSASALALAATELARFRRLRVRPVVGRYPEDLGVLDALPGRRLVLFLGSNIGNYDPAAARALLAAVRRHLAPGDAMLIGADLFKARAPLVAAYDDARGVTAQFSKNVLARLNRDLGADFDLDHFHHVAIWNRAALRMELYLESDRAQTVSLGTPGVQVRFAAGERIHTESSYKLTRARLGQLLTEAGLRPEQSWYDDGRLFGVHLARVPERGRR